LPETGKENMMDADKKKELYQQVTAGLIEQMEQGVAIWQQPWVVSKAYQPQNGFSSRLYNGFNRIYLGWMQESFGSNDPRWFTFGNVKDLGAKVRKGSKSTIVVYNAPAVSEKENDKGEVETYTWWNMRFYKVFHASQIDGLPEYDVEVEAPVQPDGDEDYAGISVMYDWCDANLSLEHGSNKACYIPSEDQIRMPDRDMFHRSSWYAQTLAHEIVHATGADTRLNRLEKAGFGTDSYAKEELVAEFGAAMMCGALDIPADMEQSAAYLKGWAQRCKDEPSLLVSAANMAEKAVDYMMEDVYASV
jgi:antirestriction protein ArdC